MGWDLLSGAIPKWVMMHKIKAFLLAASALAAIAALLTNTGTPSASAATGLPFPRLGNYYLGSFDSPSTLARWDVAVVFGDSGTASQYGAVKAVNPNIKLLPYVASEEPSNLDSPKPNDPASGFSSMWNLQRADGSLITGWGGNQIFDASGAAPWVNGQRWVEHLAAWTTANLHNKGRGDGIFYDNAWGTVDWLDNNIDTDRNFQADLYEPGKGSGWVNAQWVAGMQALMSQTRAGFGSSAIVIGNGNLPANATNNGRLNEGFDGNWVPKYNSSDWYANLHDYLDWVNSHYGDFYYILSKSPEQGPSGQYNYQMMRFYLGTTLLGDGYFAFDDSVGDHHSLWWYDEFSVDFASGHATGDASKKGYLGFPHGPATQLPSGLWERVYDNGIVLVNPTGSSVYQDLGGSYRLIKGNQDPGTNTGATVTGLTLASRDGRILLNVGGPQATPTNTPKPSSTPTNTPVPSGTPTNTPKPSLFLPHVVNRN